MRRLAFLWQCVLSPSQTNAILVRSATAVYYNLYTYIIIRVFLIPPPTLLSMVTSLKIKNGSGKIFLVYVRLSWKLALSPGPRRRKEVWGWVCAYQNYEPEPSPPASSSVYLATQSGGLTASLGSFNYLQHICTVTYGVGYSHSLSLTVPYFV